MPYGGLEGELAEYQPAARLAMADTAGHFVQATARSD